MWRRVQIHHFPIIQFSKEFYSIRHTLTLQEIFYWLANTFQNFPNYLKCKNIHITSKNQPLFSIKYSELWYCTKLLMRNSLIQSATKTRLQICYCLMVWYLVKVESNVNVFVCTCVCKCCCFNPREKGKTICCIFVWICLSKDNRVKTSV